MSETHDQDDLPPQKKPPERRTLGIVFGEGVGAMLLLVILIALGGVLAWLVIGWMD